MSKNEGKIALLIDQARTELDKIDNQAVGAKTRIVQDLAKELRPLLPHEEIAEEIVVKLKGKVGKTLVYKALGDDYKNKNRVKAQKKPKKQKLSSQVNLEEDKPLVQVAAGGESIISEPYSPGAKPDRNATYTEKQAFKIRELETLCLQKDKALIDLQDKLKHVDRSGYSDDVTQELLDAQIRIKELEQPFTFKLRVDIGRHRPLAEVRVRPARKEVVSITFPEEEMPSEMFA